MKTILITGGTGSFGNAVLKRFVETDINEVRIFSRDEKKQDDMRKQYTNAKIKFYIGDVRDISSVESAIDGVDYIFHAAALKQVPSCEFYPLEAIKTNTLGAENVMTAAIANSVKKVILLSTDKAVYPVNAMGMSKALMEKIMVSKSRLQVESETVFCATRYGNVMASRGSVIPLFVSQIKNDQPITITDRNMTRFLMSLDESVDLVMTIDRAWKKRDYEMIKSLVSDDAELSLEDGRVLTGADAFVEMIEADYQKSVVEEGGPWEWTMNYAFAVKPTSDKWGEYVNARFTGSSGIFEEWYQIKDGKLVSWTQSKRTSSAE